MSKERQELSNMVISAELTLISIIQGAALYFLVNTSYEAIVNWQYQHWPFIASGLLVIFIVWSRTLMHIFTVIEWPLEFGHNFLYIVITLFESVMFTQLASAPKWFAVGTAFWTVCLATFAFDMQMYKRLNNEKRSRNFVKLVEVTGQEQLLNIRVFMPLTILFYGVVTWILNKEIVGPTDYWFFGLVQFIGLLGYLLYSLWFYKKITPLVLAAREQMNH